MTSNAANEPAEIYNTSDVPSFSLDGAVVTAVSVNKV